MTRILVKLDDFILYLENNKTDRLDNNNVIWSQSKSILISNLFLEKAFDGIETNYSLHKNQGGYLIIFNSKSNSEYRFDLMRDNQNIYHLGFSLSDSDISDYEELTDKGESMDVFNRLIWILRDVSRVENIKKFFIGSTNSEKKNRIYQYLMRYISKWEKRESDQYESGWGIYFEL